MGRPSKKKIQQLKLADRRHKVVTLRLAGHTLEEIRTILADEHEIQLSTMQISRDLDAALTKMQEETASRASQIRTMQLERIQLAVKAIWVKVTGGDLQAVRELRGLMEREAKLTGADAPTKIDIEERLRLLAEQEGVPYDETARSAERFLRENQRI